MPLHEILKDIDGVIHALSAEFSHSINYEKGLGESDIDGIINTLPFVVPESVKSMYRWHNGIVDNRVFGVFYFMSIDESIRAYEEYVNDLTDKVKYIESNYNLDMSSIFSDAYFPFMSDGGGGFIVIRCDEIYRGDNSLVRLNEEIPSLIYGSCESMLKSFLECHKEGAFFVENPEWLSIGLDVEMWIEISKRNNPNIPYWSQG